VGADRIVRGSIVNELAVAARHALELTRRELLAVGVEPADYHLVSFVGFLQPVTRSTLARETGMRRTTLRDAIRPLVERGLLREEPHPHDGRAALLSLGPAGQEIFERGLPVFQQRVLGALNDALGDRLDEVEEAVWTARVALQRLVAERDREPVG
jgi:DNA-binding MarR family transcriptional regulator